MELPDNLALGYIVLVDGQKLINNMGLTPNNIL
jgi:hypothetical protein